MGRDLMLYAAWMAYWPSQPIARNFLPDHDQPVKRPGLPQGFEFGVAANLWLVARECREFGARELAEFAVLLAHDEQSRRVVAGIDNLHAGFRP